MSKILQAAAGGLGSLASSIIGGIQSRKNVKDTIQAQKEMAEYAYSKDLEQWERANLYNEPSQQMSRLRAAGLNPNLVYGNGAQTSSAATLPKYQAPRPDYSGRTPIADPTAMLGQYQDFKMKDAQIDTVKAERDIKELHRNWMLGQHVTKEQKTDKFGTPYTHIQRKKTGHHLYDTQLQVQENTVERIKKESESKGTQNILQKMEVEWFEMMKKAGIGSKIALPLLRFFK